MEKIVQTAGRDALGAFAPAFAHYNDDVLFGENWNDDAIDLKTRSILTVVALMSSGVTDSSLKYHLQNAKNHGVTQKEIAAIITHVAFYVGWPKGWAVFNMAKEIWAVEPENAAILSGGSVGTHLQMGIGDGVIPENLNQEIYDEICIVTDEEAIRTAKELARREGLMCGISSGTNVAAALKLAKKLGRGKTVLTVLPDTAERYFSTPLFGEE